MQEHAAKKVDIIKIWVDDRDGKFPKLTPPLYSAVIDEAHKHKLRVTAHIFYARGCQGTAEGRHRRFAHGIRDRDVDDEFVALLKARPAFVLIPNMPDRGVSRGLQLAERAACPDGELQKIQAARPIGRRSQRHSGIQAPQPEEDVAMPA